MVSQNPTEKTLDNLFVSLSHAFQALFHDSGLTLTEAGKALGTAEGNISKFIRYAKPTMGRSRAWWQEKINAEGKKAADGHPRLEIMQGWKGWETRGGAFIELYAKLPATRGMAIALGKKKQFNPGVDAFNTYGGVVGSLVDRAFPYDRAAAAKALGTWTGALSKLVANESKAAAGRTQEWWQEKVNAEGEKDANGQTRLAVIQGWPGWAEHEAAFMSFYGKLPVSKAAAVSLVKTKDRDLESLGGMLGRLVGINFSHNREMAARALGTNETRLVGIISGAEYERSGRTQEWWQRRINEKGEIDITGRPRLEIVQGWKGWDGQKAAFMACYNALPESVEVINSLSHTKPREPGTFGEVIGHLLDLNFPHNQRAAASALGMSNKSVLGLLHSSEHTGKSQAWWERRVNALGQFSRTGRTRLEIIQGWQGWEEHGPAFMAFYEKLSKGGVVIIQSGERDLNTYGTLGGVVGDLFGVAFPRNQKAAAAALGIPLNGILRLLANRKTGRTRAWWHEKADENGDEVTTEKSRLEKLVTSVESIKDETARCRAAELLLVFRGKYAQLPSTRGRNNAVVDEGISDTDDKLITRLWRVTTGEVLTRIIAAKLGVDHSQPLLEPDVRDEVDALAKEHGFSKLDKVLSGASDDIGKYKEAALLLCREYSLNETYEADVMDAELEEDSGRIGTPRHPAGPLGQACRHLGILVPEIRQLDI